ncbi:MAG: tetraacyldisaccharide 4'-kinase [Pseudomonadota bacterium]
MRAPAFWFLSPGILVWFLAPLSWIWRFGTTLRRIKASPKPNPVPVICIGNLTVGGAGKTPTVAAIAMRLSRQGRKVAVVSRGYGGKIEGPHQVGAASDLASDVGDEPLLLAQMTTVWVARDRSQGVRSAAAAGAEVVLLDDGYQNPNVVKDASVLVVDAEQGFGNGHVLPAGPLREPVEGGIDRADHVILIGNPDQRSRAVTQWPLLRNAHSARLMPLQTGIDLSGQSVVAFAGIGRPQKFFDTLNEMGAQIVQAHAFADHHVYSDWVIARMLREAQAAGAMLVTTEKDAIKLPEHLRRDILALPVRLDLDDWSSLDRFIDDLLD